MYVHPKIKIKYSLNMKIYVIYNKKEKKLCYANLISFPYDLI